MGAGERAPMITPRDATREMFFNEGKVGGILRVIMMNISPAARNCSRLQ